MSAIGPKIILQKYFFRQRHNLGCCCPTALLPLVPSPRMPPYGQIAFPFAAQPSCGSLCTNAAPDVREAVKAAISAPPRTLTAYCCRDNATLTLKRSSVPGIGTEERFFRMKRCGCIRRSCPLQFSGKRDIIQRDQRQPLILRALFTFSQNAGDYSYRETDLLRKFEYR